MNGTAHASYSFLTYILFFQLIFNAVPPGLLCFLSLLFGMFPDIDGLFWRLLKRRAQEDNSFQHHLYYPTHWPVTYTPLVAMTVVSFIFDWFPSYFLVLTWGIYCHLIADSVSCGDGMNWGAPWGRRFINLFSKKTDGYHGNYWGVRYRRTVFFKLENVAAVCSIAILAFLMINGSAGYAWYILGIAGLALLIITGFIPIDKEFEREPPGGRYDDYRKIPEYYNRLPEKKKREIKEWSELHPLKDTAQ
ncbi:MAG: metal-dependent hydrolase [Promethearchaeota archaeon]